MRLTVGELASACDGQVVGAAEVVVDGAAFDSRAVAPGQLFVPVVAERDGHAFVGAAIDAGAAAYLSSAGTVDDRAPAIVVADTEAALLALGRLARRRLGERVVGITGSVGKTTVKDLAAAVLARRYRTTANPRSFNNELGLPTTLLGAPEGTEAVVVEMGMRGFGEIARLCDVARPTVGAVTVIGEAHTGRVGGVEGVARAKGELIEALPANGTAILNADQPVCRAIGARSAARVVGFGTAAGEVRAERVVLDQFARASFVLASDWGRADVHLALPGAHNAVNAAAAAAIGLVLGVPLGDVAAALESAAVSAWRMELHRRPDGVVVVNDAYNANPTSVRAALDALAALDVPPGGRRVAVFGPMAELDDDGPAAHRGIAAAARSLGIELVVAGTGDYGVAPVAGSDSPEAIDPAEVVAALWPLQAGDAVLVKGSRVARLERVAALLTGAAVADH